MQPEPSLEAYDVPDDSEFSRDPFPPIVEEQFKLMDFVGEWNKGEKPIYRCSHIDYRPAWDKMEVLEMQYQLFQIRRLPIASRSKSDQA